MIEEDFDQFVEEDVIYVNYGLKMSRDQDGYFCKNKEHEDIMVESPMAIPKKDLAKMIDAIENLPHLYEEYLSLGEEICKSIPLKEYFIADLDLIPKI